MASPTRAIAFYLPQFHPIPENDEWWGPGFTEWTNVTKARPLFRGHEQPRRPADLGYYDLRVPEVRERQAALAAAAGIHGFCYWHYWFGNGKTILDRPFREVLASGNPQFPFCLGWANESWTGVWHGNPGKTLMEQEYPGEDDHRRHFDRLLPAFLDPRAIRVDGKPLFFVYYPQKIPDGKKFTDLFRTLAQRQGLPGLYLVGSNVSRKWQPSEHGYDAATLNNTNLIFDVAPAHRTRAKYFTKGPLANLRRVVTKAPLRVARYEDAAAYFFDPPNPAVRSFPMVPTNWDNTPRSGALGTVLTHSSPAGFQKVLVKAAELVASYPADERIVFLKSWNEWAEGNYLEPDETHGHGYLEAARAVLNP